MQGISSKALSFGGPENKKKYQGYEHNTDFDLNTYETFYRTHDPQIGRWWQIDPKPESGLQYSPYVAMNNNPISLTDLLGDIVEYERGEGVTKKEFRQFKREIRQMKRNSESFKKIFNEFKKSDQVFNYKATNSSSGGETVKTSNGYQMSISIHAKFPEQSSEKFSRIEQVGHESGHAWMKKNNLEPTLPRLNSTPAMTKEQSTSALNEYRSNFVNYVNTKEINASHIGNIINSELINSGNSNFSGLNLAEFYYGGLGTKLDVASGLLRQVSKDLPLLEPPRTKDFYLNTKFNLYAEYGIPGNNE